MMGWFSSGGNREAEARAERLLGKIDSLKEQILGLGQVRDLKEQISALEIERSKKQEEYDRQERELRHQIGLEKKRQEFEVDAAKRDAVLAVREENLKKAQERFEEQLKFHGEQFDRQIASQNSLLSDLMKRLPQVDVSVTRR